MIAPTAAADPPPAAPPLAPPQDVARLACPGCGRVLRFVGRPVYGAETTWPYCCPACQRPLGQVVVSAGGLTQVRLAAVVSST